jgi:hypothetical protein
MGERDPFAWLDERLARVCRCCGLRAIGDDGRCTKCGTLKKPPTPGS